MKTLTEELHDNNVIFSYYGFIDESVLTEVLRITKSKLEGNKEPLEIVQKVSTVLSDCVDNIIKHNFYPDDSRVKYKSLLAVSKQGKVYSIDTINVVNDEQKKIIDENLTYLTSGSKEELGAIKSQKLMNTSGTDTIAVPGLIELVLKADGWKANFKKTENKFLFNLHFDITSQS